LISEITYNVKVSVETFYQEKHSNPLENEYFFAYRITILNGSEFTIKLLRRHWFIYDSNSINREVEGEGVIGQQPVLEPGETYQYVSGCNLRTALGKMKGNYLMERLEDKKQFYINIPSFVLAAPLKLN
jgi:ApaG protein